MGKGDKKSKRGKIANKSCGVRRPRKIKKKTPVEEKISIQGKSGPQRSASLTWEAGLEVTIRKETVSE